MHDLLDAAIISVRVIQSSHLDLAESHYAILLPTLGESHLWAVSREFSLKCSAISSSRNPLQARYGLPAAWVDKLTLLISCSDVVIRSSTAR